MLCTWLVLGCSAQDEQPSKPDAEATAAWSASTSAIIDIEPGAIPAPVFADFAGGGACAGVRAGDVADRVRARLPELAEIVTARPMAADGARIPPPPRPEGAPPEPRVPLADYVLLDLEPALGAVFFRGENCADRYTCESEHYWYFATDTTCEPQLLGQHQRTRSSNCWTQSGDARWNEPPALRLWDDCNTDFSAQPIAGRYDFILLVEHASELAAPAPVRVTFEFSQGDDLGRASLRILDSGSDWLDHLAIEGEVVRKRFRADPMQAASGSCSRRRTARLDIDLEQPSEPPGPAILLEDEAGEPGCSARRLSGHALRNAAPGI